MKPKIDYTKLDAAILRSLRQRPGQKFDALHSGAVASAADDLTKNERTKPAWRIVDRRLQALRKAGKIEYQSPGFGWRIKLEVRDA